MNKPYNIYTVFDKKFLASGLALHSSLIKHCPNDFHLWILCLDEEITYKILEKLNLENVTLVHLKDVEDTELLEAKETRTLREYSWTLKPSVANFIFNKYPNIETLMYLDSDIYFYASPESIFNEIKDYSVLLFPHRLPEGKKNKEEIVGKYNAGMIVFRNDKNGRLCLDWWRKECNAWCYHLEEPGRLGDQKYLDFFAEKFVGIKVSENLGVDVAPWNIKNYRRTVENRNGKIFVMDVPLVCFHFSLFNFYYPESTFFPNGPTTSFDYTLPSPEKKYIYDEYIKEIYTNMKKIIKIIPNFREGTLTRPSVFKTLRQDVLPLIRTVLREKLRVKIINKQMSNKKRILVTGGLGFIGSNFIELLLRRGYHVINVDKMTYAARTDLNFDQNPSYEFIRKDICDLKELPQNISYLVNFAAESHVDNSLKDNSSFFKSNVGGVYNLLELIRKVDMEKRPVLIHISTDEVYGDILEGRATEENRLRPSSPYSATKAAADQLVFGWSRSHGIKYRMCRSGNNYGYGQQAEKLIPHTIKTTNKSQKMKMHGDGSYKREWIQVEDNCEAILLIMEKGKDNEIYNVSTNEEHTNLEVVKTILKAMDKPEDFFEFVPNRPGQDLRYSTDASKIRTLGWTPKHTLEEHIPTYLKQCEIGEQRSSKEKTFRKRILNKLKKIQ